MISKYAKNRVSVFIDASNIYYSQKKIKWQIDFKKLLDYLRQELDLQEIYYYPAMDLEFKKQTRFLNFLEMIGYKVRSKKLSSLKIKKYPLSPRLQRTRKKTGMVFIKEI